MIAFLALLAGLLAGLVHPPFHLIPGLLGYALVMHLADRADRDHPLRSSFLRGWLAGSVFFALSCFWVAEAFAVYPGLRWLGPIAVLLLAGGLGLFWGLGAALYRQAAHGWGRKAGPLARPLIFAGTFTIAEWLRGHVLTGLPWNLAGEAFAPGGAISQGAALVGTYGLSFIVLYAAAALCQVKSRKAGLLSSVLGAAALLGLFAYGHDRLRQAPDAPAPDAPMLRLVQANIPQRDKYDDAAFQSIFDSYLRLTAAPAARAPDIIIWPEGALPIGLDDYLKPGAWTEGRISESLQDGQVLMMGGWRYRQDASGETAPYNSLAAAKKQGAGLAYRVIYDKYRLVPFGEYLPLEGLMRKIGVQQLVPVGDGFKSGPPPKPVAFPGLPLIQPLICYEDIFPGLTPRWRSGAPRPSLIVVVSNDAWFGRAVGPRQHLSLAAYRAIEEGVPMARVTPTGVSAMIDAYGRILAQTPGGVGANLDHVLPASAPVTFYGRYGDLPLLTLLALASLAVVMRRIQR